MIFSFVIGPFAPLFAKFARKGEDKKMVGLHFGLWFLHYGLYSLIPFFAVLFGSKAVQIALQAIPKSIMNGLTVAGNLLPAVGMAMLLLLLWDNKLAQYYFLGVVLMAYLKLPLMAIAVIAAIVAVAIAERDMSEIKLAKNRPAASANNQTDQSAKKTFSQEEEDFFA